MASQQWHQAKTTATLKQKMLVEAPIVKEWSKTPEATAVYPGIDGNMRYNPQVAKWETPPDSRHLAELLEDAKVLRPDLNLSGATWDDVCEHIRQYIEDAQSTYEAKGKNNKVRSMFRNGETVAVVAQHMVELFPDEFGLGTLRAGLSYIFQAWQTRIENAAQVLGALSDILDLLVSAKKDAQILGRIDLREEMSRLGRTVIEVIPQLVKVLNGAHQNTGAEETTGRKRHAFANRLAGMKRVFRPLPEFEKTTLASAIESMNKGKERWNETVERSGLSYTVATFEMTASTYNNVKAIQKAVSEHTAEVTHLGVEVRALRDEMANYQAGLTTHKPEVSPAVVPVINYFTVIVADDEMKRSFIRTQQGIGGTSPSNIQNLLVPEQSDAQGDEQDLALQHFQATAIDFADFMDTLMPINPLKDVEVIFRQAKSMAKHFLDRARWLMASKEFREWLLSGSSSLLFVDGHTTQVQHQGKTSPLSVILASLARSLVDERRGIVLQFYCGHSDLLDPALGPNAMIRSLIAQLLLFPKDADIPLDYLDPRALEDMRQHKIEALCYCFEHLLRQLEPNTPVYIILDGVSYFEARFLEDLRLFVGHLRQWVDSNESGPHLKVLLGSAGVSHELTQYMDRSSEYVSLSTGKSMSSTQLAVRGFGYQEPI